ncbi:MAG: hypothetical protein ABIO92_05780, partial [Chloroflexia bacterium]
PKNVREITHPPLRRRLADVAYLLTIGTLALLVGAASLFFFKPATGMGMSTGIARAESIAQAPAHNAAPVRSSSHVSVPSPGVPTQIATGLPTGATQTGQAKIDFNTGGQVIAGEPATLTFGLPDDLAGKLVPSAGTVGHESGEPMHLFIVNRDLNYFDQVHPQPAGAPGQYSIRHSFPAPGEYVLYNELDLNGEGRQVHRFDVQVSGAQKARLARDLGAKKSNGYVISLEPLGDVRAGQTSRFVALVSRDTDADTAASARDEIKSLVGTESHIALLDQNAGSFAHIDAVMSDIGLGPSVGFTHRFERSGLYRLWLRFSKDGKVTLVDWVVEVK